jgi:hypothetical protein
VLVPGAAALTKAEAVAALRQAPRWTAVTLSDRRVLRLAERVTVLCYTALARRDGDAGEYRALVASGYARRGGPWELVFHQQTPAL